MVQEFDSVLLGVYRCIENMSPALRWGIAGVGMMAHDFLTAMSTLWEERRTVVAALAGAPWESERACHLAALHKVKKVYETYDQLAEDDSIDIVFVCVTNVQNFEITKKMLKSGKHVLCEKPMGITYRETKVLVYLARKKKVFLLEGMWSRFFPAYDALNEHISSGGLGEIYHLNIQFGVQINDIERNLMKDLGGGVVLDLGVYLLQFAQFIYKDPPTDIVCTGHLSKLGMDESMSCALKYSGGRTASLSAHTRATMPNRAEIVGTKGIIVLDHFWCPTVLRLSGDNISEWTLSKGKHRYNFHNSAGLIYEIQECLDCIDKGLLESPKMSLDESVYLSKLAKTLRLQLGVSGGYFT